MNEQKEPTRENNNIFVIEEKYNNNKLFFTLCFMIDFIAK